LSIVQGSFHSGSVKTPPAWSQAE